ncbi:patatin-like phospholipase family protein [Namhaeicola litoreus]|uniref:Patatin-like phospholipase family protein n=1 Tax=Namhaeicola litoreus TaxID=1052145 RepID=A0ABW3XX97_9FLAO
MTKKIGLILSGGGVRTMAHIGLIKCLNEENIKIDAIGGTSAGAVVAAMYANGYETKEMLDFFKNTSLFRYSLYTFSKPGIIDSEKFISTFKKIFPRDAFEQLRIPTYITATNLLSGKLRYFTKGELIRPLIASSALPPVFSPIEINGELYCDGGILDNFPIQPLKKSTDVLIGSFINPLENISKNQIDSTLKLIYRVYQIGLDAKDIKKFKHCNYVFIPQNLKKIGVLDTKSIEQSFQLGYEQAKKEIDQIKLAIN